MKCALVLVALALVGLAVAAPHKKKEVKEMKKVLALLQQKRHMLEKKHMPTKGDIEGWARDLLPALCHADGLLAGFVQIRQGLMDSPKVPQDWKDNMPTAEEMLAEAAVKEGLTPTEYAASIGQLCQLRDADEKEAVRILAAELGASIGIDKQYPGVSPMSALIAIKAALCEGPVDFMEANLVQYLRVVEDVLNVAFAADPEAGFVATPAEIMANNLRGAMALDEGVPQGATVSNWIREGVCSWDGGERESFHNLVMGLYAACWDNDSCTEGLNAGVAHIMSKMEGPGSGSGSGSGH